MPHKESSLESDIYYSEIQRALAKGNAAVMVGAGFSRNAEGGNQLPTWNDLAKELTSQLDPSFDRDRGTPSINVTQLAEQYACVFSTPALEDLLKRMIPDERVAPNDLYEMFLALQWSEIFTTNYDTLLERAADKSIDKAHFTIVCREDIPHSTVLGRRRIVKLHGSFPSQRPFIFTEEDYRTYPVKFAPFVNLVRQSLLENVFCLIGFSGDDPNFLHWLGWVRDVLDKHALPVYLFLASEPTLGQRKLLQSRGVTPVLLPAADSGLRDDYAGRYTALFRRLSLPLKRTPDEWGAIEFPDESRNYLETSEDRYKQFLNSFPVFSTLRSSYPGWIVAPSHNRARLESSLNAIPNKPHDRNILKKLQEDSLILALAVLSTYAWCQDVLLAPLDDSVAELALSVVKATHDTRYNDLHTADRELLIKYAVNFPRDLDAIWISLAIAVLRWARQRLSTDFVEEISRLIAVKFPQDGQVKDSINYELIQLCLYQGERYEAWIKLREWRIESADPYFFIRKATLTAELGAPEEALPLCEKAILLLRDQQRVRPDDPQILSQEAWACFVADRIKDGIDFLRPLLQEGDQGNYDSRIFGLRERLAVLAGRGYDARKELDNITCMLRAEAQPPFRAKYKFGGFELGSSSSVERFGTTYELRMKIEASLSWLELAERLAIPIRTTRIRYFSDQFIQAAWWAQYGDSYTRVLSIFIRCMQSDTLKPKDEALPPHRTGWLSRYQIATLPANQAEALCSRIFGQIIRVLKNTEMTDEFKLNLDFYIEVFSRLVIRVEDSSKIMHWGSELLDMYSLIAIKNEPSLWRPLTNSISRIYESLPRQYRVDLLLSISAIPCRPPIDSEHHYAKDWPKLINFDSSSANESDTPRFASLSESAISELKNSSKADNFVFERLFWLNSIRAISDEQQREIADFLWKERDEWFAMPGFNPFATFIWGAPENVDLDTKYMHFIATLKIARLSSLNSSGARSWGFPANNDYFVNWRSAIERNLFSVDDFKCFLDELESWLAEESNVIGMVAWDDAWKMDSIIKRMTLVDEVVSSALILIVEKYPKHSEEILERISILFGGMDNEKPLLPRIGFVLNKDSQFLIDKLSKSLLGDREIDIDFSCKVSMWMIKNSKLLPQINWYKLIDTAIAVSLTRRMPGLIWSLPILRNFFSSLDGDVSEKYLTPADDALGHLFDDLRYMSRSEGSGIIDDAIPLLRFQCFRLAYTLVKMESHATVNARRWIEEAHLDPLPEIRLGHFSPS